MPEDIPVMEPLYLKELHYRLLTGVWGAQLRHLYMPGTPSRHIAGAIAWLRENFAAPLHIKELAERANLSKSMRSHFTPRSWILFTSDLGCGKGRCASPSLQ